MFRIHEIQCLFNTVARIKVFIGYCSLDIQYLPKACLLVT